MRRKINEQEKMAKMMNGNTRRMMTYLRISDNIMKHNNPNGKAVFNDVLVSNYASQGAMDLHTDLSLRNMTSACNQTGSGLGQPLIYQRDAQIGQSNNFLVQSYASDSKPTHADGFQTKVNGMNPVGSANTFSIFDNNSFDKTGRTLHGNQASFKN